MFLLLQFAHILLQNCVGFSEVLCCKKGYRQLQNLRLQQSADGKQLSNVTGREGRDNGAAVGNDCDQSFGVQLAEGFTNGNAADLVLVRDCVLAELSSLRNLTSDDLIA